MQQKQITAKPQTYLAMLNLLCQAHCAVEQREILQYMHDIKLKVDEKLYLEFCVVFAKTGQYHTQVLYFCICALYVRNVPLTNLVVGKSVR